MSMETITVLVAVFTVVGVAVGGCIGFVIGGCDAERFVREQAIKAGVGEYNRKTGLFQWKARE
jgi:hypothetical protein